MHTIMWSSLGFLYFKRFLIFLLILHINLFILYYLNYDVSVGARSDNPQILMCCPFSYIIEIRT